MSDARTSGGWLGWMARNRVTPNLLMLVFLLGGLFMSTQIKQEVFPDFDLEFVNVDVSYPGASPEEVERGIVLVIEEAMSGVEGVKEVTSTAAEGSASISAEVLDSADPQAVLQDVKQEVDRVRTLPEAAEEPSVSRATRRREVLNLIVAGDVGELVLREATEQVRERLLQTDGITQVELTGVRSPEIAVEIPRNVLRTYGLTLEGVAQRLREAAVEVPGGSVDTSSGEILLRMTERRDFARQFALVPIVTTATGSQILLRDLGTVTEGFEDTDEFLTLNGRAAMGIDVYRVGDQTPIGISDAAQVTLDELAADLPPGVEVVTLRDRSEIYRQRLELLLKNGFMGLVLVLVVLGLFLEWRVAFWVMMGIPTSFLGALLFLPIFGVSINMISMFSFIIALGIVVDDAIVAGENIHEYRTQGLGFLESAVLGARDVIAPVTFSILTNIVAFMPLAFIPGQIGRIFQVTPLVVSMVFLISWVEALVILPSHLGHGRPPVTTGIRGALRRAQQGFARVFEWLVERLYRPVLVASMRARYLTVAVAVGTLVLGLAYATSGRMGIVLMPRVESDEARVTAVLPNGSATERAQEVARRLTETAQEVADANGGRELVDAIYARVTGTRVHVRAYLTEPERRPLTTAQVTRMWRDRVGELPGLESLKFQSDGGGPGGGAAVTVELSHRDTEVLDRAAAELAAALAEFETARDVDDGTARGKDQLDLRMRAEGRSLGLTASSVASQVRAAFHGAEAIRQQRGREELKVRVRLPEAERSNEADITDLTVRVPSGRDVPLTSVVDVVRGRAYTTISHRGGRRTTSVTADVVPQEDSSRILASLSADTLPQLLANHPGLTASFEGRQAEMRDGFAVLIGGFGLAMVGIYFLLAIPFGSYAQPLIVMVAIPFGLIGAIAGHVLMDFSMSMISLMGVVALSGVVVNDSLVLIEFANGQRRKGRTAWDAMEAAGVRRFRPVLLTTLTTFGGLSPMIFETSRQARFMIPMAISLGFGILFATVLTVFLVPSMYMILDDFARLLGWSRGEPAEPMLESTGESLVSVGTPTAAPRTTADTGSP